MEKIIDIGDEEDILKEVDNYIFGLKKGLSALSIDFGFHLDDAWKNKTIDYLSHDIKYRLSVSKLHFHLLFNHLNFQREKLQTSINSPFSIGYLEIAKEEQAGLLDSIAFHLSSVMDYTSTLIHYIISKKIENKKWNSLAKYAKGKTGIFHSEALHDIRNVITEIHNAFANPLFAYRSEIIHESSHNPGYKQDWDLFTNKVFVVFSCNTRTIKYFKSIGPKENRYTISYFAQFLIKETIQSVSRIISVLRKYLSGNLKKEDYIVSNKKPLIYFDKDGNKIGPASVFIWKEFDKFFPS